jgi:phosphoesterase RecJ-like protein
MLNTSNLKHAYELITNAKNIVITSHKSPDGDSIGSSLGLFNFLNNLKLKSNISICHPDKKPYFLDWLDSNNFILTLDHNKKEVEEAFNNSDLIFCLDYNSPNRIGKMETLLTNSNASKIMIDHHQNPNTEFVDIIFSEPEVCSTSQLIYEFIEGLILLDRIDENVGTPLYCGIMTDTGSFRFPSTTAKTHLVLADLINRGVINYKVHENTFDTNTLSKLKLNGYAISNKLVIIDNEIAYISLSAKELKEYEYTKGDTEGLVNQALSISGIKMAAFFKEDDGYVKISFRSKGDTYVNVLAGENFDGGGHIYAAGGKFEGSLKDATEKFVTSSKNYVK